MNLSKTYLGFTNNLKPMQAGKIEKSLDQLIRYEGKIMTEKEYIYTLLKEGFRPEIQENYSYYSRKLDAMTKPKTRYVLINGDYSADINKTLLNFAKHILDNGFLENSILSEYINNEQGQKELANKLKEEENKLAEEQRQQEKEELERKQTEIRNNKIANWIEKGSKYMNDRVESIMIDSIENNLTKYNIEISTEERKLFISEQLKNLPQLLGNKDYMMYSIETHEDKDYFHRHTIEVEFLMNLFDISKTDGKKLIKNKIENFYSNIDNITA